MYGLSALVLCLLAACQLPAAQAAMECIMLAVPSATGCYSYAYMLTILCLLHILLTFFLSIIVASCSSPAASGRARLPQCLGAQVMIHEVLEAWGNEGLQTHVRKMQTEYKKRAAIVQEAAGKVYSSIV